MQISGANLLQNINSIQQMNQEQPFANAKLISDTEESTLEISEQGRRMGGMMERAGKMPPPQQERMTEMTSAIEDLNLSDIDVNSLTDDQVNELTGQINDVLESFKPEDMTGEGIDLTSMSTEDQKSIISQFSTNAESVLGAIGTLGGMKAGRPPQGGRPPKGGGGANGESAQAISAYESLSTTKTDEEDQLSMIEKILAALTEDDENGIDSEENASDSQLYKLIGDYLSTNLE